MNNRKKDNPFIPVGYSDLVEFTADVEAGLDEYLIDDHLILSAFPLIDLKVAAIGQAAERIRNRPEGSILAFSVGEAEDMAAAWCGDRDAMADQELTITALRVLVRDLFGSVGATRPGYAESTSPPTCQDIRVFSHRIADIFPDFFD